jgi:hypothetical protein
MSIGAVTPPTTEQSGMGGHGWTWLDMAGHGWAWVDMGGHGWTWLDMGGLKYALLKLRILFRMPIYWPPSGAAKE